MADGTQLKIADKNDFAEEDPFAELTRIMGFDPRQPVRREAEALSERAEPAMDDFGIDLEKELLGELAAEDLTAVPERAAYVEDRHAQAYAPVEAPVAYAPAHARAEPAFAAEPNFDDALTASFEQEFSLEDELMPREEPAYAPAPAYAPQQAYAQEQAYAPEPAYAPQQAYAQEQAYAPEPAYAAVPEVDFTPDAAFDDAVEASFDQHLSIEDELLPVESPAEPVAVQQRYASVAPDFDADLDAALADVDMDFGAHGDAGHAAPAVVADELPAYGEYRPAEPVLSYQHENLVPEAAVATPVAQDRGYDEFEQHLRDALSVDAPAAAPVSQVAYEPVHAPEVVPAAAAQDNSLEDELNALLGSMSSQSRALSEPVAAPVRASEPVVVAPAASYTQPQSWVVEQPVEAAPQDAYRAEGPQFDLYASEDAASLEADAGYAEPTYDRQSDADVSFDDDAFDLALNSAAEQAAPVAATAVQPAPDRPLAAARYAQARSWGLGTPVAPRAAAPVAEAKPIYQPDAFVPVAETYVPRAEPVAYASQVEAYAPQVEEEQVEQAAGMEDELEAELFAAVSSFDDAPEIETVDVPEKAVALADDLDIPELSFEDETPPAPIFDDLDGEFTSLMNEMNASDNGAQSASSSYAPNPYASGFDRKTLRDGDPAPAQPSEFPAAAAGAVAGAAGMYAGRQASLRQGYDPLGGFDLGTVPQAGNAQPATDDDFAYDPDFDEAMAATGIAAAQPEARPARRGMMIAALLAGVAVIGGVGAWALSSGGSGGSNTPVLVKADESPIKVRPENPGGVTVPNQDNKVYDRVAGSGDGAPTQQKLVTNAEEPVDVTAQEAEPASNMPLDEEETADAPAPKSEDRVDQAMQANQPDANTETAAVAPRKVRTMVVRPDGTLVPREDPAPAPVAAAEPADPAPQPVAASQAAPKAEATGTVPVAAAKPASTPVAAAKPAPAAKPQQTAATPSSAPIAPQRPSEQPVDVVGEVKPDQVAAVAPSAPSAAASGVWAMQIASQPSEEAAKSTYQDLLKRYGSVLNGHEASIVKAEIAGKGTFWRVRVPAASRNDAVALCESYKAAGGNCFVSK